MKIARPAYCTVTEAGLVRFPKVVKQSLCVAVVARTNRIDDALEERVERQVAFLRQRVKVFTRILAPALDRCASREARARSTPPGRSPQTARSLPRR